MGSRRIGDDRAPSQPGRRTCARCVQEHHQGSTLLGSGMGYSGMDTSSRGFLRVSCGAEVVRRKLDAAQMIDQRDNKPAGVNCPKGEAIIE